MVQTAVIFRTVGRGSWHGRASLHCYPISLQPGEERLGTMRVRIKSQRETSESVDCNHRIPLVRDVHCTSESHWSRLFPSRLSKHAGHWNEIMRRVPATAICSRIKQTRPSFSKVEAIDQFWPAETEHASLRSRVENNCARRQWIPGSRTRFEFRRFTERPLRRSSTCPGLSTTRYFTLLVTCCSSDDPDHRHVLLMRIFGLDIAEVILPTPYSWLSQRNRNSVQW